MSTISASKALPSVSSLAAASTIVSVIDSAPHTSSHAASPHASSHAAASAQAASSQAASAPASPEAQSAIYRLVVFVFLHVVALSSVGPGLSRYTLALVGGDSSHASYWIGAIATGARALNFFSNPAYGVLSDGPLGRKRFLLLAATGVAFEMALLGLVLMHSTALHSQSHSHSHSSEHSIAQHSIA